MSARLTPVLYQTATRLHAHPGAHSQLAVPRELCRTRGAPSRHKSLFACPRENEQRISLRSTTSQRTFLRIASSFPPCLGCVSGVPVVYPPQNVGPAALVQFLRANRALWAAAGESIIDEAAAAALGVPPGALGAAVSPAAVAAASAAALFRSALPGASAGGGAGDGGAPVAFQVDDNEVRKRRGLARPRGVPCMNPVVS